MTRRRRNDARRGGFTIMHMMAAIAILGILSLVAAQLFSSSMKAAMDSQKAAEHHVAAQAMLRMLRDDAWTAISITIENETTVRLPASGAATVGRSVVWKIDEPGVVTRTMIDGDAAAPRTLTWRLPPEAMTFHREGPLLILRSHGRADPAEAAFVSEWMLLNAGTPSPEGPAK